MMYAKGGNVNMTDKLCVEITETINLFQQTFIQMFC